MRQPTHHKPRRVQMVGQLSHAFACTWPPTCHCCHCTAWSAVYSKLLCPANSTACFKYRNVVFTNCSFRAFSKYKRIITDRLCLWRATPTRERTCGHSRGHCGRDRRPSHKFSLPSAHHRTSSLTSAACLSSLPLQRNGPPLSSAATARLGDGDVTRPAVKR